MKIYVMDLDGTQIDPTESSLNERKIILNHLPSANAEDLISEAEEYTLSHPLEFSWTVDGIPGAFVEDSYMWRSGQVKHLWNLIEPNVDKDKMGLKEVTYDTFNQKMYEDAIKDEKTSLKAGVKTFVDHLFANEMQPVIVTNSRKTKGERCVKALGRTGEIPVYGNALKFVTRRNYPFRIGGKLTYSDRPHYQNILEAVMYDYRAKPRDVTVIGDVFTMDLSLPIRLGMNCLLVENEFQDGFKTPQVFVEYAEKHAIPVVSNISRTLK
jgi:phosphoglycolate phosphatase-like HAD superfamily hydrolase